VVLSFRFIALKDFHYIPYFCNLLLKLPKEKYSLKGFICLLSFLAVLNKLSLLNEQLLSFWQQDSTFFKLTSQKFDSWYLRRTVDDLRVTLRPKSNIFQERSIVQSFLALIIIVMPQWSKTYFFLDVTF